LGLKYLGPYKVIKKVNEVSHEIEAHGSGKRKVVNVNHLKPYYAEVLADDLPHLPDLPNHLDLDGLPPNLDPPMVPLPVDPPLVPLPADPPLVPLDPPLVSLDPPADPPADTDPTPVDPDLIGIFDEGNAGPSLDPTAQPFVPKRSRQPPKRYGHNVGFI
jgi:hypothetical protein